MKAFANERQKGMSINIIEDEIDKKRRELLERGRIHREAPFSPLEVKNPKPGRVYRAVFDDPRRIAEVHPKTTNSVKTKSLPWVNVKRNALSIKTSC